jgi:hypothetical protein
MSAAYSCDELRLMARLAGALLPACLDSRWSDDDRLVADVVATRSLLARGVATHGEDALRLTDAVAQLIAPLSSVRTITEVHCVQPGGGSRFVTVDGDHGRLQLAEREPDVWQLAAPAQLDLSEALDDLTGQAPSPLTFTMERVAFDRATRRCRAGRIAEAADQLAAAGLAPDTCAAWLSALRQWRSEGHVRLTERQGPQGFAIAELAWLDGRSAGLWQITPACDLDTVTVRGTSADELRATISQLLTGAPS